jgi:hypothetical protein
MKPIEIQLSSVEPTSMKQILTTLWLTLIVSYTIDITSVQSADVPTVSEAAASKQDLWGEAAIRQPNGPSYAFFEKLLPPPRYVDAEFHYYPLLFSAPNSEIKAHLISNGSGINLRGLGHNWADFTASFHFRVGLDQFQFGGELKRLEHPTLADGFLPIFEVRYLHPSPVDNEAWLPIGQKTNAPIAPEIYKLEAFGSTDEELTKNGMAFVKFSLAQGKSGVITVIVDTKSALTFAGGKLTDGEGKILALFDKQWKGAGGRIEAKFSANEIATLAIATKPIDAKEAFPFTATTYGQERDRCAATWRKILGQGMNVETPEPVVNNAWRHLIIQNFELVKGNRMHYSSGNSYDGLYEAEGSDAALAFLVWGHENDIKRLMGPLFDFTRKGLEFHQAGFKINNICRYYWQTRDASVWTAFKKQWQSEISRLDKNRTGEHGLFPEEQYCGDVHSRCQSLNVNSKAWRALRDLGATLEEIGDPEASHYLKEAAEFRPKVLNAIRDSAKREVDPPFVPIALYSDEGPHDPITEVRIGGYWNIIIGYTIASGIFPVGSEEESWIPNYQEQHGGLVMGMIRAGGPVTRYWNSNFRINPLYGTRYTLDALRRDDVNRALVSFYGMLAQGFTRNTFVCGEGGSVTPLDEGGRFMSLPPNSAANAHFLSMLRYMLVQDYDLNDDGKPDTLRLCFATPKRWLEDGKTIKIEQAPTAFGPVSVKMDSHLSQGYVTAEVALPKRNAPNKILLRARLPDGWKITSVAVGSDKLSRNEPDTVDLSALKGKQTIKFAVANQ